MKIILSISLLIFFSFVENYFFRNQYSLHLLGKDGGSSELLIFHLINSYLFLIILRFNYLSFFGLGLVFGILSIILLLMIDDFLIVDNLFWFDRLLVWQQIANIFLIAISIFYLKFNGYDLRFKSSIKNIIFNLKFKNFRIIAIIYILLLAISFFTKNFIFIENIYIKNIISILLILFISLIIFLLLEYKFKVEINKKSLIFSYLTIYFITLFISFVLSFFYISNNFLVDNYFWCSIMCFLFTISLEVKPKNTASKTNLNKYLR